MPPPQQGPTMMNYVGQFPPSAMTPQQQMPQQQQPNHPQQHKPQQQQPNQLTAASRPPPTTTHLQQRSS
jgi:hypothetical protein